MNYQPGSLQASYFTGKIPGSIFTSVFNMQLIHFQLKIRGIANMAMSHKA